MAKVRNGFEKSALVLSYVNSHENTFPLRSMEIYTCLYFVVFARADRSLTRGSAVPENQVSCGGELLVVSFAGWWRE